MATNMPNYLKSEHIKYNKYQTTVYENNKKKKII